MGKSTTAAMFAKRGIPIWDADAAVARLYAAGGAAVGPLSRVFPDVIIKDEVSKEAMRNLIAKDPDALAKIEAIVHPLVQQDREKFISEAKAEMVILDIPLLFETRADDWLDFVLVVSVSKEEQERRVMERKGMTRERFEYFLEKQLSDAHKRENADAVISTETLETAQKGVDEVIARLSEKLANA